MLLHYLQRCYIIFVIWFLACWREGELCGLVVHASPSHPGAGYHATWLKRHGSVQLPCLPHAVLLYHQLLVLQYPIFDYWPVPLDLPLLHYSTLERHPADTINFHSSGSVTRFFCIFLFHESNSSDKWAKMVLLKSSL